MNFTPFSLRNTTSQSFCLHYPLLFILLTRHLREWPTCSCIIYHISGVEFVRYEDWKPKVRAWLVEDHAAESILFEGCIRFAGDMLYTETLNVTYEKDLTHIRAKPSIFRVSKQVRPSMRPEHVWRKRRRSRERWRNGGSRPRPKPVLEQHNLTNNGGKKPLMSGQAMWELWTFILLVFPTSF